jgi:ribosomal protein S27E|tara:strand:- start:845 stop:1000 length:156 start_codon:yes stop_codon:yes gene_type:complete
MVRDKEIKDRIEVATIMLSHDLTFDYLSSEDLSGTMAIIDQLKQSLNVNHA